MDNFNLKKFLAEGKLHEANSPELDKAKEDYMAGKISLADYQAIVKKLDFKGVKDAEVKAQAKADALAAEKKELEDKKAAVKQAEKDRKAGKISQEEFAKIIQNNQYINKESLSEVMSPQDVVDIADTVAEEFTKESAEEGDFLIYTVGRMEADDMSFELDTDVSAQTPDSIDTRGVGEGWGGIFRIKPSADGYEVRNAEKGGLVAMIDNSGNFRMLSAAESRAEMGLEENKEETKSNKMKKSELKEMIKSAFLNETSVEETLVDADQDMAEAILNALGGEAAFEAVVRAMSTDDAQTYLGAIMRDHDIEMEPAGDIPGFEGTMDALDSLSIREEEEEDVEVEDKEEIDVDTDAETADAGEVDVEADAKVEMTGDTKEVQDNLQAALEAAKALGDQKLVDQIGNSITFFTRTHVVGKGEVAEADVDVEVDSPVEDAEVGMKLEESINRMKKLAGLIK